MADSVNAAGMPDQLSAVDYLLHRGEANPRTRSGILSLEILDTTPDWERFRATFEAASRKALRLREKVVVPTLPTAAPRWVVDPDFNLDYHVRRIRVPEPGTLREVLDQAELLLQAPLDTSRPLWTATLVEGLAEDRAATLIHLSHAVTDGVGGVEMFSQLYDLERDPPPKPLAPMPIPRDLSSDDLMREGINRFPLTVAGGVLGTVSNAVRLAGRIAGDPVSAASGAFDYARSSMRMMQQAAKPSPLLLRRSLASRTETLDIVLADLHRAAKAAGGSINDAYLAGLCGVLRRYHVALGVPVATLPMAVPVNLRTGSDPAGGNRFTGVNLAAPIAVADPAERIRRIRAQMTQRREERALGLLGAIAPLLSVLPTPTLESLEERVIAADVQASNIPMYPGETYIAGAKVLRQYGLGPLPGVAMMVVLLSRDGICTISVRYDRAAITDRELFARCLHEGFDEVLALAGDPAPRAVPASFTSPAASEGP
ncbi:wax ester/triacylglycerol synthase family O-acyltransferase [Mycobacterium sp. 1274756.6]|uniref:wax ester/triacylglycerol synthase family O-acyltransferase n=1 Tax=Mycobacterium sp. 1274756.6 TaxID=1834076 RepID=UPI0008008F38|nr:wax ester/triacylglycerol synthase family O-acyltransferase [Mycobacterium sp. 1274756.6]OBJ72311.1 diacylglycerol O-acyltransferase [Mycobacterium sp. 1274756.6]